MRTLTSGPPANMKWRDWSRKRSNKLKRRVVWLKKKTPRKARRARKRRKTWKAQARSSAHRLRLGINSAPNGGPLSAGADVAVQVDGGCVAGHGTSHHGRCRRSAIF